MATKHTHFGLLRLHLADQDLLGDFYVLRNISDALCAPLPLIDYDTLRDSDPLETGEPQHSGLYYTGVRERR